MSMEKLKLKKLFITLAIFMSMPLVCCKADDSYETSRREMVETQIKARGIKDPKVLSAMLKVQRHLFVAERWRFLAYVDRPLPIGKGQTISQPYIVALMTELLALKGKERVLEIGTGSGYQAAVLAEIVSEVYSIEIIPDLSRLSKQRLELMGYKNIKVICGDGYYGWPEHAPFDAIIVTCGASHVPPKLVEQLKVGGRMVIPVGKGYQKLMLVRKEKDGRIITKFVTDVIFVPLLGGHE